MNLKLVWKTQNGRYQLGADVYSGRIRLGVVYYNGGMSIAKSEEERKAQRYAGRSFLPGKSDSLIYAPTEEEARVKVERMIRDWFARLEEAQE